MNVSELARRAGIAPSAVRWYESIGAFPAAPRRTNGYRVYRERDVQRLRLLVTLRRLGLSPIEAGRLVASCRHDGAIDLDLAPLIARQRVTIARQRADLDSLEAELLDLEQTIEGSRRAHRNRRSMPVSHSPIRVLFLCTGNSARSQIAEAMLVQLGGEAFEAHSAGTHPKGVNPWTVRTLAEAGIDWSAARSKSVDEYVGREFDYVITVCDRARQECPVFPGAGNSLHWGLDDPAEVDGKDEAKELAFRRTRLELAARLRPFIEIALRTAGRATADEVVP